MPEHLLPWLFFWRAHGPTSASGGKKEREGKKPDVWLCSISAAQRWDLQQTALLRQNKELRAPCCHPSALTCAS